MKGFTHPLVALSPLAGKQPGHRRGHSAPAAVMKELKAELEEPATFRNSGFSHPLAGLILHPVKSPPARTHRRRGVSAPAAVLRELTPTLLAQPSAEHDSALAAKVARPSSPSTVHQVDESCNLLKLRWWRTSARKTA